MYQGIKFNCTIFKKQLVLVVFVTHITIVKIRLSDTNMRNMKLFIITGGYSVWPWNILYTVNNFQFHVTFFSYQNEFTYKNKWRFSIRPLCIFVLCMHSTLHCISIYFSDHENMWNRDFIYIKCFCTTFHQSTAIYRIWVTIPRT